MANANYTPEVIPAGQARFATTRWSLILKAGGTRSQEAASALESLFASYWYPLYAFVRRKGHDPEAAFDLTQEFLARLLEKDFLATADPNRGRFRTFLLTALERFLIDDWVRSQRLKRGGGRRILPLEPLDAENRYCLERVDERTPERLYERQWALVILERTLEKLDGEHRGSSREAFYLAVRNELSGTGSSAPKAELAARLGMSAGAIKTGLHRLRRRYGELLRQEIAETVASPEEVEDEIRHLFQALS